MKKIHAVLLTVWLGLIASACIRDDAVDCAYHIQLKYDYNMDYVDKFTQQAETLQLYLFDGEGRFAGLIKKQGEELKNSNTIDLTFPSSELGQTYTFLAWVGVDTPLFHVTTPTVGVTTLSEIEVALQAQKESAQPFLPVMVGKLSATIQEGHTDVLSLTKNTNKFRIAFRVASDQEREIDFKAEDYHIYIASNNTRYNSNNEISSDQEINYRPYYQANDDRGFLIELNTLRLVDGRMNYFIVENAANGQQLLKIDLNEYLEDLRFLSNNQMERQEFFDREDEFALILFLGNGGFFEAFDIEINGWLIRKQDYEELNH